MNTVFKVLWNPITLAFVVVSELAKSKGKSKTQVRTSKQGKWIKWVNIIIFSAISVSALPVLAANKTQTTMSFCVQGRDTGNNRSCAEVTAPLKDTKYNSEVHLATPDSAVEIGKESNTGRKSGAWRKRRTQ